MGTGPVSSKRGVSHEKHHCQPPRSQSAGYRLNDRPWKLRVGSTDAFKKDACEGLSLSTYASRARLAFGTAIMDGSTGTG